MNPKKNQIIHLEEDLTVFKVTANERIKNMEKEVSELRIENEKLTEENKKLNSHLRLALEGTLVNKKEFEEEKQQHERQINDIKRKIALAITKLQNEIYELNEQNKKLSKRNERNEIICASLKQEHADKCKNEKELERIASTKIKPEELNEIINANKKLKEVETRLQELEAKWLSTSEAKILANYTKEEIIAVINNHGKAIEKILASIYKQQK